MTPGSQELVARSSKRVPSARITSALRAALFAAYVPFLPVGPRHRSSVSSSTPLPSGVVTTGMRKAAASSRMSVLARGAMAPPPATMTGRSATASSSAAWRSAWADGAGGSTASARHTGTAASSPSSSTKTLSGTSRLTGPGRPEVIRENAWLSMSGSISGRTAWKLRFT